MSYVRTREAARAAIDSNAAQFARAGNPWDGDGQMPRPRRPSEPKPAPVRRREYAGRDDELFIDVQAKRDMAARMAQMTGKTRAARPLDRPVEPPIALTIKPSRDTELAPLSHAAFIAEGEKLARAAERAKRELADKKADAFAKAMAGLAKAFDQ